MIYCATWTGRIACAGVVIASATAVLCVRAVESKATAVGVGTAAGAMSGNSTGSGAKQPGARRDLQALAYCGEYSGVVEEIKAGANPNATDRDGNTPLHDAAVGGHARVTLLLLESGARPNIRNRYGESPLHFAAGHGDRYTGEELIAAGAAIDCQDLKGETPLHTAAEHGNMDFVVLLLRHGADPHLRSQNGQIPADVACNVTVREAILRGTMQTRK